MGTGARAGVPVGENDHATTEDAGTMHRDDIIHLIGLARARERTRRIRTALDLAARLGLPPGVVDTLETDAAYWALAERGLAAQVDARGVLDRAA